MNGNNRDYVPPNFEAASFNCSLCGAYAHQTWNELCTRFGKEYVGVEVSKCAKCERLALWDSKKKEMVYPRISFAPLASLDMSKSVKELYDEAGCVSVDSPRAAAALLRCALEKLTEELGEKKGTLNDRIGNLVKKGLPGGVQEALDIVRITANEGGSHAGEIDLTGKDGKEIVEKLFWLVNFIVEKMITEPKDIGENFSSLPKDKIQGIEDRDK